jgi:hypothetical protein
MLSIDKLKGTIGHLSVAKDLTSRGYPVFTELGDTSRVDLIALVDDKPIKIQVKSHTSKYGRVEVSAIGPHKSYMYSSKDIEVMALYVLDRNIIAYIPILELQDKKSFCLRIDASKNGQKISIRRIEDYLIFEKSITTQG